MERVLSPRGNCRAKYEAMLWSSASPPPRARSSELVPLTVDVGLHRKDEILRILATRLGVPGLLVTALAVACRAADCAQVLGARTVAVFALSLPGWVLAGHERSAERSEAWSRGTSGRFCADKIRVENGGACFSAAGFAPLRRYRSCFSR
jgi:hypothetical protein